MINDKQRRLKRLIYIHGVTILGLCLTATGAIAAIPGLWEFQSITPSTGCRAWVSDVFMRAGGFDENSSNLLARAAYYDKDGAKDMYKTDMYSVGKSSFGTPALFNQTHQLSYEITNKGDVKFIKISDAKKFLGRQISISYPINGVDGLEFIREERDPTQVELRDISFLTTQTLYNFRGVRLKALKSYLKWKVSAFYMDERVATFDGTPYVKVAYRFGSVQQYGYFATGVDSVSIVLARIKNDETTYRVLEFSNRNFDTLASGDYPADAAAPRIMGNTKKFKSEDFEFRTLWDRAKAVSQDSLPKWIRPI